jgi:predicted P-loop ATPase
MSTSTLSGPAPARAAVIPGANPLSPAGAPTVPRTSAAQEKVEGLLVDELLKDPAFAAVLTASTKDQPAILRALASGLRAVTSETSPIRATARRRFLDRYAGTTLEPAAPHAFDTAVTKEFTYWHLVELGLPAASVDEGRVSPVFQATQRAYRAMFKGGLRESYACLVAILRSNPKLVGGDLAYSTMDECETISRRPVEDHDIGRIREDLERCYYSEKTRGKTVELVGLEFSKVTVEDAVRHVSQERSYHDVQDFLEALAPWDGLPRLDRVATELLHAERPIPEGATDLEKQRVGDLNRLARLQVRMTFIAAVARAMAPGCKADSVLILKGPQGKRKSSFFEALVPPGRFSDTDIDLRNKDTLLLLRKVWVYEWSELSVMKSARDVQTVKGFLSSKVDTFRPPYGRRVVARPRHCIVVGSTNDGEFLADATGDRRFWVVVVDGTKIDLEKTREWKDQLWAEALEAYRSGERWWLSDEDDQVREEANTEHREVDPWFHLIVNWLTPRPAGDEKQGVHRAGPTDPSVLTASEVMSEALSLSAAHQDKAAERRVGAILRTLNYKRGWRGRERVWRLQEP